MIDVGMIVTLVLSVLAIAGAVAAVVVALARQPPVSAAEQVAEPGLLRLTAQLHAQWEPTAAGVRQGLGLPTAAEDLDYGQLYLEQVHDRELRIRSRSAHGRGFHGAITLTPEERGTEVRYRILRLPMDERLRERVLQLELDLVTALRSIDRTVDVQLIGAPLRETARHHATPINEHAHGGGAG